MNFFLFRTFVTILFAAILFEADSAEITCPRPDSEGITTFNIRADSPLGELDVIQIQYDTKRHLVATSTTLMDSLNAEKHATRHEPFRPYGCPLIAAPDLQPDCSGSFKMTADQQAKAGGRRSWDRGHLTPASPMRFSEEALNSTFYCINIAPQESFTNENPWRIVEHSSERELIGTTGMVMTGLCSDDNTDDGSTTARGWTIPACYWKLLCYRDKITGLPQVVGFIGKNTIIHEKDTAGKAERKASVTTPRAQSEILDLVSNPKIITEGWTKAFQTLTPGRETDRLPSPSDCIQITDLSEELAEEWKSYIHDKF